MNPLLSQMIFGSNTPNLLWLIPIAFVALVVFLIGREVVCWYLKLNKISSLLEKIEMNTRGKGTEVPKESGHVLDKVIKL